MVDDAFAPIPLPGPTDAGTDIVAYLIHDVPHMKLLPAPIDRAWMDATNQRFAYRCLPLNIANQLGWMLTSPCTFEALWYGSTPKTEIEIRFLDVADPCISTHFGYGVMTFSLPYLFRTPPGINLYVKGPANQPKDGIAALEGVVETDWATSTFTMNWKFTRAMEWVRFERGEPIAQLIPIPRGLAESLTPKAIPIAQAPEIHGPYQKWEEGRKGFIQGLQTLDPETVKRGWQKDYFQGKFQTGGTFADHQTRLGVKPFPPP
ncbi:MAG: DUF6065 family protein, partial [Gemmataceae bacterium]